MTFLWHHALWLLLALPLILGAYLVLLHRRNEVARRYGGLAWLREALGPAAHFKTHIPALLLFIGVTALLLSAARPVLIVTTPSEQGTVVLLMDVSLSMAASDVPPTRLEAARAAAKAFVHAQPAGVRIAVVAFGGHADVVQPPTTDREALLAALDNLELQRFTAIGNGLMGALLTLVPTAEVPRGYDVFGMGRPPPGWLALEPDRPRADGGRHKPVGAGSALSTAIVLVSDGRGTMGVHPLKAAKMIADAGVRVFTVGVGTLYGGVANIDGWPAIHAEFEEDLLHDIAAATEGEYFLARTTEKVASVYEKLGRRVVLKESEREMTALFTALGILLLLASAGLSLAWSPRPA